MRMWTPYTCVPFARLLDFLIYLTKLGSSASNVDIHSVKYVWKIGLKQHSPNLRKTIQTITTRSEDWNIITPCSDRHDCLHRNVDILRAKFGLHCKQLANPHIPAQLVAFQSKNNQVKSTASNRWSKRMLKRWARRLRRRFCLREALKNQQGLGTNSSPLFPHRDLGTA